MRLFEGENQQKLHRLHSGAVNDSGTLIRNNFGSQRAEKIAHPICARLDVKTIFGI